MARQALLYEDITLVQVMPEITSFEDTPQAAGLTSQILENSLPHQVADVLEELYKSIYCTIARLKIYDSLEGINAYVSMRESKITCLLLFRIIRKEAYVLNQQIDLDAEQANGFCTALFERYSRLKRVHFYALRNFSPAGKLHRMYQAVPQIEENIATLPETQQQFLARMSAQTRGRILRSIRKIKAEHPSYEFLVVDKNSITAEHLHDIAALAARRMLGKGARPYLHEADIPQLLALARTHGRVALLRIDGRIVAGNLLFQVADRCFSQLIAHDPDLNAYGLGNQLQLQVILLAIDEGTKEFWMMGGSAEDKARFLTTREIFESITVYRSRTAAMFSWRAVAANTMKRAMFDLKNAIKASSGDADLRGKSFATMLRVARALRLAIRRVTHVLGSGRRKGRP